MPLTPPPVDDNGNVVPHDHDGIVDQDRLIRRVSPQHVVSTASGRRLSTMAFQAASQNGGLSVDLETQLLEDGEDPVTYVAKPPFIGSVVFPAGDVRALGFKVGFNPLPPDLPHHGEIWGVQTKSQKRALQQRATWHRPLADVSLT
ncbi:hypothetical protein O9Z70_06250 [Devosia sp. YIM 151766]|uniref:hypothetical protein n=1 Tax=Devosia sp. YIM 151766 TaxID=3017325 RepID=UPI00255CFAC2|nr:hypothetical protein [Devosia sp. YIM 151766]WIY54118.1 hypothetical protein O9Z70_06250 [Devosia sp. YIM 151766]